MHKYFWFFLTFILLAIFSTAQAQKQAEMADALRADGKIWVVVAIIVVILAGLVAYLFLLDKKVKKLENQLLSKHPRTK
ncbi:MAG: CcmD family protein [Chryseolinea sp.]